MTDIVYNNKLTFWGNNNNRETG